ncbi:hypothetical protein [Gordonia sp. FQ]|uniref:hypothetical protein n=1 Tax=Gordonia sp. FQ TaxID=3446634 RepID=UPI003F85B693
MTLERFVESVPAVEIRTRLPVVSVAGLLLELDIPPADRDAERTAVAAWLTANTPTPQLRASIERRGWGDLLDTESRTA